MGLSTPVSHVVSVVVVSHNEGENLSRTIASLLAALPSDAEIVVVDDMSTDGSIEGLPAEKLRVLRPEKRLGIASARNLGASQARGDVVIFSDAHVDVTPGFLDPLLSALDRPGVGAVGPIVSMRDNPSAKGYGFRWRDAALNVEWLGRQGQTPHPVPMLVGCFVAVRRDAFEDVGGFDSEMIVYGHEDAELSMRLWTLGYECLLVPEVDITHLFRVHHPYSVDWTATLHNLLRVAIVHFGPDRFRRVVACLRSQEALPSALARLLDGNAWEQRRLMRARRTVTDEWFFEKFHMHW
jgi:GT2 family glycosyltransferase